MNVFMRVENMSVKVHADTVQLTLKVNIAVNNNSLFPQYKLFYISLLTLSVI